MTETLQLLKAYIEAEGYEIEQFPPEDRYIPVKYGLSKSQNEPKEDSIRAEIANKERLNTEKDFNQCIGLATHLGCMASSISSREDAKVLISKLESMKDKL